MAYIFSILSIVVGIAFNEAITNSSNFNLSSKFLLLFIIFQVLLYFIYFTQEQKGLLKNAKWDKKLNLDLNATNV